MTFSSSTEAEDKLQYSQFKAAGALLLKCHTRQLCAVCVLCAVKHNFVKNSTIFKHCKFLYAVVIGFA